MLLLGIAVFNLFYLSEKLRMLRVVNEFHDAQFGNDKQTLDKLLTDDFTETGVRRFVQTPEFIYKRDVLRLDYSDNDLKIQARHLLAANIFNNNRRALSFVKVITFVPEDGVYNPPIIFFVTYTFEDRRDGLKISKIERHF